MANRVSLVLNSQSGTARERGAEAVLDDIRSALGARAAVTVHDASEDFDGAVKAACATDADHLVIAGGDGTAAGVLTGMARSGCTLPAVPLPLGTANLLPRRLYGERSVTDILSELDRFEARPLHAGAVGEQLFFVALMAGYPVRLGQAREALRPDAAGRQPVRALARMRQAAGAYLRSRVRVSLGEGAARKLPRSNAVLIVPGGIETLTQAALPGAAAFDHVTTRTRDVGDTLATLAGFLSAVTRTGDLDCVRSEAAATLSGPNRLTVMLDGEPVTLDTPVSVTLKPDAVRVAVPRETA